MPEKTLKVSLLAPFQYRNCIRNMYIFSILCYHFLMWKMSTFIFDLTHCILIGIGLVILALRGPRPHLWLYSTREHFDAICMYSLCDIHHRMTLYLSRMTLMVNIDQSNIYTPLHLSVLGAVHLSHTCKCDNYVINICMSIHHMYNIVE